MAEDEAREGARTEPEEETMEQSDGLISDPEYYRINDHSDVSFLATFF